MLQALCNYLSYKNLTAHSHELMNQRISQKGNINIRYGSINKMTIAYALACIGLVYIQQGVEDSRPIGSLRRGLLKFVFLYGSGAFRPFSKECVGAVHQFRRSRPREQAIRRFRPRGLGTWQCVTAERFQGTKFTQHYQQTCLFQSFTLQQRIGLSIKPACSSHHFRVPTIYRPRPTMYRWMNSHSRNYQATGQKFDDLRRLQA